MSTQKDLRIRSRTILLLLLPISFFLLAAGWLLTCLGDRTHARPPQRKQTPTQYNGTEIHVVTVEESEQYTE